MFQRCIWMCPDDSVCVLGFGLLFGACLEVHAGADDQSMIVALHLVSEP